MEVFSARFQVTTVHKEPDLMRAYTQKQQQLLAQWSEARAFHHGWTERLREQIDTQYDDNLLAWLRAGTRHQNPTSLLEQWGTLGHPWHPNYKTKLGLSAAQVIAFSPEFEASFPIVLCALHRQYAHVEALEGTADYRDWWQGHFPQAAEQLQHHLQQLGLNAKDYLPLPSHPWQAHKELPEAFADEIADNLLIVTESC